MRAFPLIIGYIAGGIFTSSGMVGSFFFLLFLSVVVVKSGTSGDMFQDVFFFFSFLFRLTFLD